MKTGLIKKGTNKVCFNEIVEDDEILLNLSAYPHIKFL
jgi:hypothetical protein